MWKLDLGISANLLEGGTKEFWHFSTSRLPATHQLRAAMQWSPALTEHKSLNLAETFLIYHVQTV